LQLDVCAQTANCLMKEMQQQHQQQQWHKLQLQRQ
jgi:hypothetical protein